MQSFALKTHVKSKNKEDQNHIAQIIIAFLRNKHKSETLMIFKFQILGVLFDQKLKNGRSFKLVDYNTEVIMNYVFLEIKVE